MLTPSSTSDRTFSFVSCCRVPSHMNCVLSALSLSRLDFIQTPIRWMQDFNWSTVVCSSLAGQCKYSWVSSAYECTRTPSDSAILMTSAVYSTKSSGPRTEPCGTPKNSLASTDLRPQKSTVWLRPSRNDASHDKAFPLMPYERRNRSKRISWSTVSNAALRSSIPSIVTLDGSASAASKMSEMTFSTAVSVAD